MREIKISKTVDIISRGGWYILHARQDHDLGESDTKDLQKSVGFTAAII